MPNWFTDLGKPLVTNAKPNKADVSVGEVDHAITDEKKTAKASAPAKAAVKKPAAKKPTAKKISASPRVYPKRRRCNVY